MVRSAHASMAQSSTDTFFFSFGTLYRLDYPYDLLSHYFFFLCVAFLSYMGTKLIICTPQLQILEGFTGYAKT